jgi:hypothetical protein
MTRLGRCERPRLSDGQPCGWVLNGRECPYHGPNATPESRRLIPLKGAAASRMRRAMPASTPEPPFDTIENIVAWAQRMARAALVEDVDPRRLAEARGFAQLALSALGARTQQQLIDALLKLEHGGAAVMLLSRLQDGLDAGKLRPIPGAARVLSMSSAPPAPAGDGA